MGPISSNTEGSEVAASLAPKLSVRRFYALDYFYILLRSVARTPDRDRVFQEFLRLKNEYRLGESKFRKFTESAKIESGEANDYRLKRYRFTFREVIEESKQYGLLTADDTTLKLTHAGKELLEHHGTPQFTRALFGLMEKDSNVFRYLIERMYQASSKQPGLLIFPVYSPYQLGLNRREIRRVGDIREYERCLAERIQSDLREYLANTPDLTEPREEAHANLVAAELLSRDENATFAPGDFNRIVGRIRKHWLNYFLKMYGYEVKLTTFEMWLYRGKQCGVVHATEIYPSFTGRLIYPTSVIVNQSDSPNFRELFTYPDQKRLFAHAPDDSNKSFQERFIACLVKGYFNLKRSRRGFFVNLASLRELVCFNLKVSELIFERLLNEVYRHNLAGELPIQISLEVDKMPEETGVEYIKREPVNVDGRPRNIIGISVKTRDK